jgi:RHS repeat-associated protein
MLTRRSIKTITRTLAFALAQACLCMSASIGANASATGFASAAESESINTLTARAIDSNGGVSAATVSLNITAAANETITFLHNDLAGSPMAATNLSGAVVWKEDYRPFGERQQNEAAAGNQHQWFGGKPQDSETGLSYFGARYYDPVVGRFMGVDAVGFSAGNLQSFNRYAYGNNNPYKFVDPDGNAPTPVDAFFTAFSAGEFIAAVGLNIYARATGDKSLQEVSGDAIRPTAIGLGSQVAGLAIPAPGAGALIKTEATAIKAVEIGSKVEKKAALELIHSEKTYSQGLAKTELESQRKRSTEDIIKSLQPGAKEPLTVKASGTVMDGNTRVKVLQERGVNVNELPRTRYE